MTKDETLVGSPYYNENFVLGTIFDLKTKADEPYYLKYNIAEDYIEVKKTVDSKELLELQKDKDSYCVIDGLKIRYFEVSDQKGNDMSGFFVVLSEGKKSTFLKKLKKNYTEARPAENSYQPAKPARYSDASDYYFLNKNTITKTKLKKKKILEIVNGNKDALSKVKTEKLNLSKEKDVITLIDYYNKL